MQVSFVGEFHGGPLRDFFRFFSVGCSETYLKGGTKGKYFDGDAAAVQVYIYVHDWFVSPKEQHVYTHTMGHACCFPNCLVPFPKVLKFSCTTEHLLTH